MKIVDYNKDTKRFTVHFSDELSDDHIEFLKLFQRPSNDSVALNLDELWKSFKDDDSFQQNHTVYFDLCNWGFLEDTYDHHDKRAKVHLTELGRIMLKKILDKPIRKSKV